MGCHGFALPTMRVDEHALAETVFPGSEIATPLSGMVTKA